MAVLKNRLTVVGSIYFVAANEQPESVDTGFSRDLASEEQPYRRRLKATEEWQRLDCGWIKEASQVFIANEEGKGLQVNPTDEEREDIARRIIEVSFCEDGEGPNDTFISSVWLVSPGESMRGLPSRVDRLCVRCQHGTARFTLYIVPR